MAGGLSSADIHGDDTLPRHVTPGPAHDCAQEQRSFHTFSDPYSYGETSLALLSGRSSFWLEGRGRNRQDIAPARETTHTHASSSDRNVGGSAVRTLSRGTQVRLSGSKKKKKERRRKKKERKKERERERERETETEKQRDRDTERERKKERKKDQK